MENMINKEGIRDVFLGGTCNDSTWREVLIEKVDKAVAHTNKEGLSDKKNTISFFNPVVKNWTEDCVMEENNQKKYCKLALFCITPKMSGVYSIAELMYSASHRPHNTMVIFLKEDDDVEFDKGQWKSIMATSQLLTSMNVPVFYDLSTAATYISIFMRIANVGELNVEKISNNIK